VLICRTPEKMQQLQSPPRNATNNFIKTLNTTQGRYNACEPEQASAVLIASFKLTNTQAW